MALFDVLTGSKPKHPATHPPARYDTPDAIASREETVVFPGGADGVDKIVTDDGPTLGGREVGKEGVNVFTSVGGDALPPAEGEGVNGEENTGMGSETLQRQEDHHVVLDAPIDPATWGASFSASMVETLNGLKDSVKLLHDRVGELSPVGTISGHANGSDSARVLDFQRPEPLSSAKSVGQEDAEMTAMKAKVKALEKQLSLLTMSVSKGGPDGTVDNTASSRTTAEGVQFFYGVVTLQLAEKPFYLAIEADGTTPSVLPRGLFSAAPMSTREAKALGVNRAALVSWVADLLKRCEEDSALIRTSMVGLRTKLTQYYQVVVANAIEAEGCSSVAQAADVARAVDAKLFAAVQEAALLVAHTRPVLESLENQSRFEIAPYQGKLISLLCELIRFLGPTHPTELRVKFMAAAQPKEGESVKEFLAVAAKASSRFNIGSGEAMQFVMLELMKANSLHTARGTLNSPPLAVYLMLNNPAELEGLTLAEAVRKLGGALEGSLAYGLMLPTKTGPATGRTIDSPYDPEFGLLDPEPDGCSRIAPKA